MFFWYMKPTKQHPNWGVLVSRYLRLSFVPGTLFGGVFFNRLIVVYDHDSQIDLDNVV